MDDTKREWVQSWLITAHSDLRAEPEFQELLKRVGLDVWPK